MNLIEYYTRKAAILEDYQDRTDESYETVTKLDNLNSEAVQNGLPIDRVDRATIQNLVETVERDEDYDSSYEPSYEESYDESYDSSYC